jgi:hypothetical protein
MCISNYLIALLGSTLTTSTGTTTRGAFTADVTALATSVASLVVLLTLGAVTAWKKEYIRILTGSGVTAKLTEMALTPTVVARSLLVWFVAIGKPDVPFRRPSIRAVPSLETVFG